MDSLYTLFLILHSWNRWLILIAGLIVIFMSLNYFYSENKNYSPIRKIALVYISSLHLQFLVGIILYFFLSPVTQAAFNDFGAAMKSPGLRFWAVEHTAISVIAIILAQLGFSISKRKLVESKKVRTLFIWTFISLLLIIIVIPMGIMGVNRPWIRL